MFELVIVRHGESLWNQENRFTGWQDVGLADTGRHEAKNAGEALRARAQLFDVAFTSVLKRAVHTLDFILAELDQSWLPVYKDWRLNERHYGALQGLNKSETAALHGEEQVKIWRRSYETPPPKMSLSDERHPKFDRRYSSISSELLPNGESLADTVSRFLPLWSETIAPAILAGQRVLIVAHGNSLRALMQNLEKLSPDEIMQVNVPTGIPLLYTLNEQLFVTKKEYLGDPDLIAAAMDKVAHQGAAPRRP